MKVEFADEAYSRLETDANANRLGFSVEIITAYRRRLQGLRAARDERDLYGFRSWRFEKLKGKRAHQRSVRLNDQFRLILQLVKCDGGYHILVEGIEDYH